MKISFLFVGGHKEAWLDHVSETYLKKISYFFKCDLVRLKPSKILRDEALEKKKSESSLILSQIKENDFVVLCDEKGKEFRSLELSKEFVKWVERSPSRIVFVIGGAFGFDERLYQRANYKLSLSKLTLNHHFAQIFIMEQVYRSISIWKNLPYHNE